MNVNRVFGNGSLILAGALVALSVNGWVGAAQATPEPTPDPVVRETASISRPVLQEEDEGAWDCVTDGNKSCDMTPSPYLEDAWDSFDGAKIAEQIGAENAGKAFGASYYGTFSTEPHWPGYVAVASKLYLGTFHVFKIDVGA